VLLANKAILSNYHYKYPIFLTLLHMLACTFYSLLFIKLLKLVPYQPISSRTQMLKISGLSLIFCLSVVAGNVSLRFLPVSFNQAIGATGPFFTALFAVLMTWKTEAMTVSLSPPVRKGSLGRSRTFLSGANP
jgi:drug/metabolite transporter (DMT)-like permease